MTGSGVLLRELWSCASRQGDEQQVVVAGYPSDNYLDLFGENYQKICYSDESQMGDLPFPILGMSNVMPYPSMRYCDVSEMQLQDHLREYRNSMRELVGSFRPDVIHIHHLWVLVALASEFSSIPSFVTVHGTGLKQLVENSRFRHFVQSGLSAVRGVFCVSRDILEDAKRAYSIPSAKISFMGNGFNERIFDVMGERAQSSVPIVLAVGKFVDWKGHRFLIRACSRLSSAYRLVIIGSGPHKEKSKLEALAQREGVHDKTLFLGQVDHGEVARWMRRADVFVLPSIKEPFGLALLEALACGCPSVAGAIGGPKDLLMGALCTEGLATLVPPLIERGDDEDRYVEDLAEAIDRHLANPATEAQRRTIAATVAGMTWDNVYAAIRKAYARVRSEG